MRNNKYEKSARKQCVVISMQPTWGTKAWEVCEAICLIFILGLGVYYVVTGLMSGSVIWWYDLALPLFAFSGLGLLLLVRIGKKTLTNVVKYGFNPSTTEENNLEHPTIESSYPEDTYQEDKYFTDDEE